MLQACLPTLVAVADQLLCIERQLARCYHNGPVGCGILRKEAADSLSAHGRRRLRGSSSGRPLAVLPSTQTLLMARPQRALLRQGERRRYRSDEGGIHERGRSEMSLTNRELVTFGAKRSRYSSRLSISDDPEGSPRSAGNLRLVTH